MQLKQDKEYINTIPLLFIHHSIYTYIQLWLVPNITIPIFQIVEFLKATAMVSGRIPSTQNWPPVFSNTCMAHQHHPGSTGWPQAPQSSFEWEWYYNNPELLISHYQSLPVPRVNYILYNFLHGGQNSLMVININEVANASLPVSREWTEIPVPPR